ncbi:hypothetical protein OESDEN_05686 [Oesophagostomum dentatum]|uniref:Gamma-glutamyltranspeptidase n=1 Tax=Oesophagostomum dentatum TaxID=61180 RepID=A0A0B1TEY1_OESDE|nr:hypothetical protein OESDEN_05686 [Oesophagostomum dentatum]
MLCPALADFLQELADAENPVDYFYRGQGSTKFLKSMHEKDSFITLEDMEDCESEVQPAVKMFLAGHTLCGPPPPSIYSVVQLAVAAMIDPVFDETISKDARELTGKDAVQHTLQRFRSRYGPEIEYESTEQGSFSVLVEDEMGDAVAMTSSLGDKFGNRELTEFGFFMNNAMGSFAYGTQRGSPQSRNAPLPAKCPVTQMSPVIGIKDDQVAFLTGGTDYLGVTASVFQALTSRHSSNSEGTPLLSRRTNGLTLLNRDKSLLVGY